MRIMHYITPAGRAPVKEFIHELPEETRIELLTLLRRMERGEILTMPHCRSMASMAQGLYELRVRDIQGVVRVFYYARLRDAYYLVHGLRKKSRTIPDKDRLLILKRMKELNQQRQR